jgi:hypothetical protein
MIFDTKIGLDVETMESFSSIRKILQNSDILENLTTADRIGTGFSLKNILNKISLSIPDDALKL